jgi:hypothetical protein
VPTTCWPRRSTSTTTARSDKGDRSGLG